MIERVRTKNDLNTPQHALDPVRQLGPIVLDPCSNQWSTVGALLSWDGSYPQVDGLANEWVKHLVELKLSGTIFVNPPYGRGHMTKWADKIIAEARQLPSVLRIIALVNCDTSTSWWTKLISRANAVAYWRGRITFDGGAHGGGLRASACFYYGTEPHLFAHHFSSRADVRLMGRAA